MDIKQKIQKLLRESLEESGLTPTEEKIFKLLKMHDIKPMDFEGALEFLRNRVGLDPKKSAEMYYLYKFNYEYPKNPVRRIDIKHYVVRTANNKARTYVESLIPFRASNTSGGYISNGNYVVWSYGWYPLFIYDGNKWYENSNKYSVSTSKQTSQLRPYRSGNIEKIPYDEMKNMI